MISRVPSEKLKTKYYVSNHCPWQSWTLKSCIIYSISKSIIARSFNFGKLIKDKV